MMSYLLIGDFKNLVAFLNIVTQRRRSRGQEIYIFYFNSPFLLWSVLVMVRFGYGPFWLWDETSGRAVNL